MRKPVTEPILADGPTLDTTRDYWSLHLRSEGKSPRTNDVYLNAIDQLDAFLAEHGMPRELRKIRREHLEAYFVSLAERGLAPATISIRFRALRPFWRWLPARRGREVAPPWLAVPGVGRASTVASSGG
jgi:site-specific recombinase XerC